MFEKLKELLITKLLINGIVKKLDALLSKLPADDKKTATGFLLAFLGGILTMLPNSSAYLQPILDYLHTLPAAPMIAGGVLYGTIGALHKGIKWILTAAGVLTAKEKENEIKVEKIAEKVVQKVK